MTLWQGILLGVVQGLTEFLPVSSTAHLLIAQHALGIPSGDAMFSFAVLVQLGTLLAVLIFYWQDFWAMGAALLGWLRFRLDGRTDYDRAAARLGGYLLLGTMPALAAGYWLKDVVEALFARPLLEASIRLLAAATLLFLAERLGRRARHLDAMTAADAFIVGLFQVLAVFPGASRSGSTIAGGMLRGFDRPAAARFAFLLSVPVMLAAGAYQTLDLLRLPNLAAFLPVLTTGFLTAAAVGWLAIRWLLHYLSSHSLTAFSAYCAALGSALLLVQWIV